MVRYKTYAAKHSHLDPKSIPPRADSLRQHKLRALYQVHIWRKSLESHPQIRSPIDFGWDQNEDGHFVIAWNKVNPAPDEVLEMMFCTCVKKCVLGSCPCVDNSLKCTNACLNHDCENFQSEVEENCECDEFSDDETLMKMTMVMTMVIKLTMNVMILMFKDEILYFKVT